MNEYPEERKILHLDMDAFFASVEQAVNPRLMGKPLIVGGRSDKRRTVVCAASYEAKKMGIDSGMSCQEAFRIFPGLEFVTADSAKYLYVSGRIFDLLKNYSPQVEQASVDEFYLDITGEDKMFGSYLKLAIEIKKKIKEYFNITASVGISLNRLMSKIASKLEKPDGLVVLEKKDIHSRLSGLLVEKIPGIGKSLTLRLNQLSVFSFSDLERISLDFLYERFGKIGLWMYSLAHSQADEEQIRWFTGKESLPKSVGHSYTLPHNIYQRHLVESWLRLLCEMVGFRLRQGGLGSSTMYMYLRKPSLEFISREKNFKDPTNDPDSLYQRVIFILNKLNAGNIPVRALGVTARNLTPLSQGFLFPRQKKRVKMLNAQDEINKRFGDWTLYPASIFSIK